jgi:hypothetical protein
MTRAAFRFLLARDRALLEVCRASCIGIHSMQSRELDALLLCGRMTVRAVKHKNDIGSLKFAVERH